MAESIKSTTRFSLAAYEGLPEDRPPHSRLLVDGKLSRTKIPGCELIRQFEVPDGYLLITDYDDPWEELTEVVLLDRELRIIGKQRLGKAGLAFARNIYMLKDVEWLGDRDFITIPADEAQGRYQFTIRDWGVPYVYPRLKMLRLSSE